jgi:APA family basic amino acid/polyamine antiporter
MSKIRLQSQLTLFDVTNLVVGAIIGADIYVASTYGAQYLGPFSLVVWVVAGLMAIVIALSFAQCAALLPKVGGPYAYAREAWGPFAGFIVGWSLWLAEWVSLAVFPVAFVRYLTVFLPGLDVVYQTLFKGLFVLFLIATNIFGVRAAGRTNDVLTIVKLAPLILFAAVGLSFVIVNPAVAALNFSPFLPNGLGNFGLALVLIFWAYAGFEISTIPAEEIRDAKRTIPRAIVIGISIVTVFYLVTNVVLFAVVRSTTLASNPAAANAPLAFATVSVLSWSLALVFVGKAVVGGGALVSVAGSDESGMIGTSRLGYALAADGLFPRVFAKIHPKYKTPYLGIIIQAVTALIAAVVGRLDILMATSVFLLAVPYAATGLSVFWLRKKSPESPARWEASSIIPVLGIIFSVFLISQCGIVQVATGALMLLVGIPIYIRYSPKKELADLKNALISRQAILERGYRQEERFLAHLLRHVKRGYRRLRGKEQTWQATDED